MKILLITPSSSETVIMSGDNYFLHEPLALEYVAAGIRNHCDVKHLDMRIDRNLEGTLGEFEPDIVGTTGYTIHVKMCRMILKRVKVFNPSILTVVGGHHATISPNSFNEPYIDVIVRGEGVFTFKEIVESYERGINLKAVSGVAIPENGTLYVSDVRQYTDLDSLPFPDRSLTVDDRGKYFTSGMKPVASIRTSVGCAFRCNFCALWRIADKRYLTRDPKYIVQELSTIKEPYILIADDETFLDVKRMTSLADQIRQAGIKKKYQVSIRSDTVVRNPELIEKWSEIGLARVRIGFESYLDDELDDYNKHTSIKINEEALNVLKEKGVDVVGQFIVRPDYDRKKFRDLARYVKKRGFKHTSFSVLTPLPGTILYESVEDQLITKDYDMFDFKHTLLPTRLRLKEFYHEFAKLHMKVLPFRRYILYRYMFPLTRYIPTFEIGYAILSSMMNAYKDHERKTG